MALQWFRNIARYVKRWWHEEPTLDLVVKMVDNYIRINGLGLTHRTDDMNLKRFLLISLSSLIFGIIYVFGTIYYYMLKVRNQHHDDSDTYVRTVRVGLAFLAGLIALNKVFWFAMYRRNISLVVSKARSLGSVPLPKSSWRWSTGLIIAEMVMCMYRFCMPILFQKKILPEENVLLPGLENSMESPSYEVTYFINIFGVVIFVGIPLNFYILYICLAGHIANHFEKLSSRFENLLKNVTIDDDDVTNTTRHVDEHKLNRYLSELLLQHCKIIDVMKGLRSMYNTVLGIDFGILTFSLGILLVTISKVGVSLMLDYFLYLIGILTLYCITGQRLSTAAEGLISSVWASHWEYLDSKSHKSLLLVLNVAQKSAFLSAGTIVKINYETWMSTIKTCYSIYAAFDTVAD